jgi:lysophospholipase L1-like esterase
MNTQPIVLLGGSYLASWSLPHIGQFPIVNCGIPGNQTHELLARFEQDVVKHSPRAVIIWGIVNDVIRAPKGQMSETCEKIKNNLEAMIVLAWKHDIEPILVTDLTLRPPYRWYEPIAAFVGRLCNKVGYQQRINSEVMRLNTAIRQLGLRTGTRVLDLNPLVTGPDGMRQKRYARPDGSHLPPEGYEVINAYVVPLLTKWLVRNRVKVG